MDFRSPCRPVNASVKRMKIIWIASLTVALAFIALPLNSMAAEKKAAPGPGEPIPSTKTFFLEGVKTEADVKAVTAAAMKVKSVNAVVDLTPASGFANISFDHRAITHQQIAQGIMDAGAFRVSFKFVVPDYGKDGNEAKVDAVFARFAKLVAIEPLDKAKNLFVARFLPFTPAPGQPLGAGFNFGHIAHPIGDPAPKGLALRIQQVSEGSLARPAAAKKKAKE
jgi:copper chaperone CopZ